jgi:hypothetical protein
MIQYLPLFLIPFLIPRLLERDRNSLSATMVALDDQLESELQQLFATVALRLPLSSSRILGRLISNGSSIRLSDLPRLESLLSKLANSWEAGRISIRDDTSGMSVLSAFVTQDTSHSTLKRKRSESDDTGTLVKDIPGPLSGVGPIPLPVSDINIQDVYALLQKGTTRAKLLAKQVILILFVLKTCG